MDERKEEENKQSLQIQRGPRDLYDARYPQTDPHIPFFYNASRVPYQPMVPQEVPTPIAHHWASQGGVPLAGLRDVKKSMSYNTR